MYLDNWCSSLDETLWSTCNKDWKNLKCQGLHRLFGFYHTLYRTLKRNIWFQSFVSNSLSLSRTHVQSVEETSVLRWCYFMTVHGENGKGTRWHVFHDNCGYNVACHHQRVSDCSVKCFEGLGDEIKHHSSTDYS